MAIGMNMENEAYGIGLVRSTSFGRKRVAFSGALMEFDDCIATTPSKRHCLEDSVLSSHKPALEDLPQEILIRIICGVEHDDLKRLILVSKAIREATLIAKQSHFAYSTPRKTNHNFGDFNEVDAPPDAPKQSRIRRSGLSARKLEDISVALFADFISEDELPQRNIFTKIESVV